MTLRSTFYSSSINPLAPLFDPSLYTLDPNDPRLHPSKAIGPIVFFDPLNPYDRAVSAAQDLVKSPVRFTGVVFVLAGASAGIALGMRARRRRAGS